MLCRYRCHRRQSTDGCIDATRRGKCTTKSAIFRKTTRKGRSSLPPSYTHLFAPLKATRRKANAALPTPPPRLRLFFLSSYRITKIDNRTNNFKQSERHIDVTRPTVSHGMTSPAL